MFCMNDSITCLIYAHKHLSFWLIDLVEMQVNKYYSFVSGEHFLINRLHCFCFSSFSYN